MIPAHFPNEWRAEYDAHLLDAGQRQRKAIFLQRALMDAGLWRAPRTILDVGCGSGFTLGALDAPNVLRVGCDIRVEPFLQARPQHQIEIAFVQADVSALTFRRGAFDLIVCLAVIGEVPGWRDSLVQMAHCVTPNGILVLTMTNGAVLMRVYNLARRLGIAVEKSWHYYAEASLRFDQHAAAVGFGLAALRGWRYVNLTLYLARAQFPSLRLVPVPMLEWILQFIAPSFCHVWLKPAEE